MKLPPLSRKDCAFVSAEEISRAVELPTYQQMREWTAAYFNGRLLILPCNVGDTVFCIRKNPYGKGKYVKENTALAITIHENCISISSTLDDVLGRTVFLTRNEAEAALRKAVPK